MVIQTPYRKVDREKKGAGDQRNRLVDSHEEDEYIVAQANSWLNQKGGFVESIVMGRHRGNNPKFPYDQVDYMDAYPKQVVAAATTSFFRGKR